MINRIKNDYFAFLGELKNINDQILKYIFGYDIQIEREYDIIDSIFHLISIKITTTYGYYVLFELEKHNYKYLDIVFFDDGKYKKYKKA